MTTKLELLAGLACDNESSKAIQACNDWLRAGPGRSLGGLLQFYDAHYQQADRARGALKADEIEGKSDRKLLKCTKIEQLPGAQLNAPLSPLRPPTRSLGTLRNWSAAYNWRSRALAYDWELEEERAALERAHRLHSYGMTSERVAALKKVAELLEAQIFERSVLDDSQSLITGAKSREYHNLWVSEQKMLGSGESAQIVEVQRFNPAIIDHFRGCLKEIAQELGERHYSSDATKVLRQVSARLDRSKFTLAQLERMAQGEHPVMVLLEPYFIQKGG